MLIATSQAYMGSLCKYILYNELLALTEAAIVFFGKVYGEWTLLIDVGQPGAYFIKETLRKYPLKYTDFIDMVNESHAGAGDQLNQLLTAKSL